MEIGITTFGDVALDAAGTAQDPGQRLRDLIEEIELADQVGLDVYGVGVDEPHDATWYAGGAREVLAAGKAAVDAALRPSPHFLGPPEPGIPRALSRHR